ncbi:MAG: sodium:proton antiporter [Chloroherpetonaceae bacterium]
MHDQHEIPLVLLIPFALLLAAIAVMPLTFAHFWESNRNKLIVALVCSLPVLGFLIYNAMWGELKHALLFDYVPFLILLGALFVITGGINITGDIEAKPIINTTFMAIGAVLASLMGTTGAAMLLIRPLLETNAERQFKVHTVLFFIAVVANCGGLVTPLGDPPLFVLYLRGVPFEWFLNLLPVWLFANIILLATYFGVDSYYYYQKESLAALKRDIEEIRPIKITGSINFVLLLGVVLSVAFLNEQYISLFKQNEYAKFLRELVILILLGLSLWLTKKEVREANKFSWHPIEEVAYLFLGIFITMIPCLLFLEANAPTLGVTSPVQFFYATGVLSGVLDNTPTAVTFYSLALGLAQQANVMIAGIPEVTLKAICIGAVFFGAMTYIGNAPNFMVKAIAEEQSVEMPSFMGYVGKFSLVILLPLFVSVQLIFF